MRVRSPLASLVEVLDQVRQAAHLNQEALQANEAATRAVLIDPILRSLGWDTGNPSMVEVEKGFTQARVDYALLDSNGEIRVIVEAKRLGANLSDQSTILNIVNYAFTSGVRDIVLTDGIIWHHFTAFEPGNLGPSKTLDLRSTELVEIAAYLVERLDAARYWPEAKDVDELSIQVSALESTVSSLEKDLERLKASRGDRRLSEGRGSELSGEKRGSVGLVPLSSIDNATGTRPSRFRLPDGTTLSISSWSDVLRESVKFAMETNPLIDVPHPDKAGRKIDLLGVARPPKNISYTEVEYQGRQVFIYTNYDSNGCIDNAIHILKQVPEGHLDVEPAVQYS